MSDSIEEIQSKKQRDQGLNAWAEMLERIQSRRITAPSAADEGGGGSGLPRDTMQRQDPKISEDRQLKLQAIHANVASLQVEAHRLQDSVAVHAPKETKEAKEEPKAEPKAEVSAPQAVQHQSEVKEVQHEEQVQAQAQQAELQAEEAEVLEAQAPLASYGAEASEKFVQLTSQAGLKQPAAKEKIAETEAAEHLTSIEEALQLMALKNGVGANPELAAKEYVLASELAGVKDSLSGCVYEDFRVAL